MVKVVLISCVRKKLNYKSEAQNIYNSPLFRKNLQYAKSFGTDKIFILSAKHGLLRLDEVIEPYERTLNKMSDDEIKQWSEMVLEQLKKVSNLNEDEFIFLAGEKYRKYLLPYTKNHQIPMQGLGIGRQLKWLTEKNKNEK